jgi:hypothetical protein
MNAAVVTGGAALAIAVILRAWVIARATVPVIAPDEAGSWSIARFIAGVEPHLPMRDLPVYPLGTGLLLAPIVRSFTDPVAQYRAGLVVLGLLMLGSAVLVTLFVRRLGFRRPEQAGACFALVLLFPATALTSTYTWSEALALLSLAGCLVLTQVAFSHPTLVSVGTAGCLVGFMPFVHPRFALVPVVWLVCLAVYIGLAREVTRARRVLTVGVGAVCVLVVAGGLGVLYRAVLRGLWTDPTPPSTGIGDVVWTATFWRRLLAEVAGQSWYLVAASFGLAMLGGAWLVQNLTRRGGQARSMTATVATTLLVFGSVALTSITTMTTGVIQRGDRPRGRLDYFVHGRYLDGVVVVLAAIGLAQLMSPDSRTHFVRRFALVVGAMFALGAVVVRMVPTGIHGFLGPSIAGVYALPVVHGFNVVGWSAVSAIGFATLLLATRTRPALSLALCGVLFATVSWSAAARAVQDHRWARKALYEEVSYPVGQRDTVVVAADAAQQPRYRLASFAQEFVLTARGWDFEFSPLESDQLPSAVGPAAGVMVLARDQAVDESAWRLAGQWDHVRVWVARQP